MATTGVENTRLFSLYTKYVGEPESRKHVYGYWLFLVGCAVSFLGVLIYQLGPTDLSSPQVYLVREVSTTLAGVGLPVGLLGIVLMLPVKRRPMLAAVGGAGVALLGVGLFTYAYPYNWVVTTPDYSGPVITVYTLGVAIVAGVAALVPVVTGENSFYFGVDWERSGEHPDVMVGEADRGAAFAVYRSADEWNWRLVEQSALAGESAGYLSRLETEERVERVRSKVKQAGLIEVKHAAFRLYEVAENQWRWLLMRDDGSVVADSGDEFDSRDDAAESVSVLKEHGPDAPVIDIQGAAFDFYRESGEWYWKLVDEDRDVVATSPEAYDDRSGAETAAAGVKDRAGDTDVLTVDGFGVELHDEGDEWRWRLLDAELDAVMESAADYGSRGRAESAVYDLLDDVGDAPVLDANAPAYEVYRASANAWRWRLVDDGGATVAESGGDGETAAGVAESAEHLKADAERAEILEMDDAAFEYYRIGDRWRWRLVTETRDVVAESTTSFESRERAADAVETAKEQALAAELIDFENAAFQLYETDGEWRWRLIDEDGNVMADSGEEHDSRDGAASSMMTLKQNAPDADLLEIETAAFELFHDEHGNWNWRLVDEGGQTIAQGDSKYPSRDGAKKAMDRLVEKADDTESREMTDPVFHVYADANDEWWWEFLLPSGTISAESARGFATRDEAETAIEDRVRKTAGAGAVHEIAACAFRLAPTTDGNWRWELVDTESDVLAESVRALPRETVTNVVRDLQRRASHVAVFELQDPTFFVVNRGGVWEWDFADADRTVLARGFDDAQTREAATATVDRVKRVLPAAETLDYENAVFEVYDDGDEWQWRLVDADESVIAADSEGYGSRTAVKEAIGDLKAEVDGASILEIDAAAFELYESDGEWRWRLTGENGNELAESHRAYPSHREAREAMNAVKDFGDDALIQVAE